MSPHGLPIESTARTRSRIAIAAAVFVGAFGAVDVLRGVAGLEVLLAARLVWVIALLAASRLILATSGRWTRALVAGTVVLSIGALFVISLVQRADVGPLAFLIAAPLLVAVLLPDMVCAVALASGLATVAVGAAFLIKGAGAQDALVHAFRTAVAGTIAVLGATTLARVRREELRVAEERATVAEALARSERRRAEVEPLAAAGSTAARVAHDMSNPLASIRVNLDWLREVAEEGRLGADEAEVREVLRETRECVDRLGANLADFRAAARGVRAAAGGGATEALSGEGGAAATLAHIDVRSRRP